MVNGGYHSENEKNDKPQDNKKNPKTAAKPAQHNDPAKSPQASQRGKNKDIPER